MVSFRLGNTPTSGSKTTTLFKNLLQVSGDSFRMASRYRHTSCSNPPMRRADVNRFAKGDSRSSLFSGYDASQARNKSRSPQLNGGYGYSAPRSSSAAGAYPGASQADASNAFRAATPNRKGQYSDAVLSELESQNDDQVEGMSARVKMLKDVCTHSDCAISPWRPN